MKEDDWEKNRIQPGKKGDERNHATRSKLPETREIPR